jgi:hypothetical protein
MLRGLSARVVRAKIMLRSFFVLGGFDGVLGWFRLFVGLDGCARILFGGFWIVIGTGGDVIDIIRGRERGCKG